MTTSLPGKIARWTALIALFLIPLIPLYVANDLFFPFITGKGFAFRILVEIAFGAWIVLALADPKYRPRFSWTFVLYGGFVLWMLIADLFAVNPYKALWSNFERMDGWVTLIHVFLFFVVASSVLAVEEKLNEWWWRVFIIIAAVMCAYGFLQLIHAIPIHQGSTRVDSRFGNAIYFAAYLLFACAVSVWQALKSKNWMRYVYIALAVIFAFFIYETETRGAIFGLVVGVGAASVLWMLEAGKEGRRIAAGLLILVVIAVGGLFLARSTPFVTNNSTLARIASAFQGSEFHTRLTLWGMAFAGVAERPITGWGQEGFNYIFQKYYEPSLFLQEPWFDRAHNEYIDWLVAGGIPGLALFLAAFLMAAWAIYRSKLSREERVLLLAALAAYGAQGMTVFDNLFSYIPFAAILAIAHAQSSRPWKVFSERPALSEPNVQLASPIIAVLILIVAWFVNVPNIVAASSLVRAISITGSDITTNMDYFQRALDQHSFGRQETREQLMSFANSIAAAQGHPSPALTQLLTIALTEMGKEVDAAPKDARLRLQYELGYRSMGDYQNALKQLEVARQLAPKKQALLIEEGLTYWQMGNLGKAAESFRTAYELDTSFNALVPYAAAGDILEGNVAKGKALLNERLATTTVNSEPLILAYFQAKDYPDLILCLEQAVRDQNGSVESRFRLAAGFAAAGQMARAREEITKAIASHPEAAAQGSDFLQHVGK